MIISHILHLSVPYVKYYTYGGHNKQKNRQQDQVFFIPGFSVLCAVKFFDQLIRDL
ncbi:hypothetical protein HMPREF0765_2466 [Sphingobacterium spiritivorum ATCC 33300]|uniref:Uncharacterized protein n=1 Tax=Sphingobacterium spiritivorum ATCC 33300 TaxID=525372 RepID=C2FYR0_SPHSI|nr:hypothetical protein HMPREF0765_2466 [Sphingobacterium spiritivorum ATCC 33300]